MDCPLRCEKHARAWKGGSTTHIEERIVSGGTEIYCVFPSFRFALARPIFFSSNLSCEDLFFMLSKM